MRNRIWWLTLLRGILSALLGVMLLAWPQKSVETVIMFIGAFAVITGAVAIANALGSRYDLWGFSMTGGLLTLLLGLTALLWPGVTGTVVIYLVAAWAVLFGVVEILAGLALPAGPMRAVPLGVGLISVALALILLLEPTVGLVAAAWVIGFYLFATGGLTAYHAIELRRRVRRVRVEGP